jgi:hypothetical protein
VAGAVGVTLLALLLAGAFLFARYAWLERRFSELHADESEARLRAVVGAPTAIRACPASPPAPTSTGQTTPRRCARVYWYGTYVFHDGWLVPIDDDGYVMQIRRVALP